VHILNLGKQDASLEMYYNRSESIIQPIYSHDFYEYCITYLIT